MIAPGYRRFILSCCAFIALASARVEAQPMTIETLEYHGWPNTYRLSNGKVEALVVTAIGPRILSFKRIGGAEFLQARDGIGGSGEGEYVFRGGWRLWVAPERRATTYALDNSSCDVERIGSDTIRISAPPQTQAGIRKIVTVAIDAEHPRLRIESRIRNISATPLSYSAWSLPVLRPGGRAFVPLDVGPVDSFDATRRVIMWSYAHFADPRYRFGDRVVEIDHRAVAAPPTGVSGRRQDESKIGVDSKQGWSAYLLGDELLVKRFPFLDGTYIDGGATIEVYSNHEFLELEHLGPFTEIAPGGEAVLREEWWLFDGVTIHGQGDAALPSLQPHLDRTAVH